MADPGYSYGRDCLLAFVVQALLRANRRRSACDASMSRDAPRHQAGERVPHGGAQQHGRERAARKHRHGTASTTSRHRSHHQGPQLQLQPCHGAPSHVRTHAWKEGGNGSHVCSCFARALCSLPVLLCLSLPLAAWRSRPRSLPQFEDLRNVLHGWNSLLHEVSSSSSNSAAEPRRKGEEPQMQAK